MGGSGVVIEALPQSVTSCPVPSEIPWNRVANGVLPLDEALRLWGVDRKHLATCRNNIRLVSQHYDDVRKLVNEAGSDPLRVKK